MTVRPRFQVAAAAVLPPCRHNLTVCGVCDPIIALAPPEPLPCEHGMPFAKRCPRCSPCVMEPAS